MSVYLSPCVLVKTPGSFASVGPRRCKGPYRDGVRGLAPPTLYPCEDPMRPREGAERWGSLAAWHSLGGHFLFQAIAQCSGHPPLPPRVGGKGGQGCIRREGASEVAPEAVRQAVGAGCQSGWRQLLLVTNAVEAGTWREGDSGWA